MRGIATYTPHQRVCRGVNGHFGYYCPFNPPNQSHSRTVIPRAAHPQGTLPSRPSPTPRPWLAFLGVVLAIRLWSQIARQARLLPNLEQVPESSDHRHNLECALRRRPVLRRRLFDSKPTGGYETARPHWFGLSLPGLTAGSCNARRKIITLCRPCDVGVSGMLDSVFLVSPLQV